GGRQHALRRLRRDRHRPRLVSTDEMGAGRGRLLPRVRRGVARRLLRQAGRMGPPPRAGAPRGALKDEPRSTRRTRRNRFLFRVHTTGGAGSNNKIFVFFVSFVVHLFGSLDRAPGNVAIHCAYLTSAIPSEYCGPVPRALLVCLLSAAA